MLMGIRLQSHPTSQQKLVVSQWVGCARFIWNAKCDEDSYLGSFARKYMPCGIYAPMDQKFSKYKDNDLSQWLKESPSQFLRNSAGYLKRYQRCLTKQSFESALQD